MDWEEDPWTQSQMGRRARKSCQVQTCGIIIRQNLGKLVANAYWFCCQNTLLAIYDAFKSGHVLCNISLLLIKWNGRSVVYFGRPSFFWLWNKLQPVLGKSFTSLPNMLQFLIAWGSTSLSSLAQPIPKTVVSTMIVRICPFSRVCCIVWRLCLFFVGGFVHFYGNRLIVGGCVPFIGSRLSSFKVWFEYYMFLYIPVHFSVSWTSSVPYQKVSSLSIHRE